MAVVWGNLYCRLSEALVNVSDNYNRSKVVRVSLARFERGLERLWEFGNNKSAAHFVMRNVLNIQLYAGITVVSGATRKSENASGAVDQQVSLWN